MMKRYLAVLLLALAALPVRAQELPELEQVIADARKRGSAEVSFFGFDLYRADLWTRGGEPLDYAEPFALSLTYERNFKARTLARTTVEEIARIEGQPESEFRDLLPLLEGCFADVKEGDRITGLNESADQATFFVNGGQSCRIDYPAFSPRFFGIWLGEETRDPSARKKLLGEAG